MGFKGGFVIGFGAGYVLGARAGRQRYEDIRRLWSQVSGSPTVQRAAERTKEAAASGAKRGLYAVEEGVQKAGVAVKDRLGRNKTEDISAQTDAWRETTSGPDVTRSGGGTADTDAARGGTVT